MQQEGEQLQEQHSDPQAGGQVQQPQQPPPEQGVKLRLFLGHVPAQFAHCR